MLAMRAARKAAQARARCAGAVLALCWRCAGAVLAQAYPSNAPGTRAVVPRAGAHPPSSLWRLWRRLRQCCPPPLVPQRQALRRGRGWGQGQERGRWRRRVSAWEAAPRASNARSPSGRSARPRRRTARDAPLRHCHGRTHRPLRYLLWVCLLWVCLLWVCLLWGCLLWLCLLWLCSLWLCSLWQTSVLLTMA